VEIGAVRYVPASGGPLELRGIHRVGHGNAPAGYNRFRWDPKAIQPQDKPGPRAAAGDIRETVGHMAMNDGETVARIAGGHRVDKAPGTATATDRFGRESDAAVVE